MWEQKLKDKKASELRFGRDNSWATKKGSKLVFYNVMWLLSLATTCPFSSCLLGLQLLIGSNRELKRAVTRWVSPCTLELVLQLLIQKFKVDNIDYRKSMGLILRFLPFQCQVLLSCYVIVKDRNLKWPWRFELTLFENKNI